MNACWQCLPDDMIGVIMSYGDPSITNLYKNVMDQLLYHKNEFNYHRFNEAKPFNRWFLLPETDYYKYVLRECFLKKHINKYYGNLPSNYGSLSLDNNRFRLLVWETANII